MTDRQRLRAVDTIWLDAEKPGPSIAIGGVCEVAGPAPTVEEVREFVASRLHRIPRLSERLSPSSLRIKRPTWEPTTADLTHHIEQMALDGEGASLEDAVSAIMEKPLDLAGPLWDIHLLTGLPGGHFALVTRMHHAAADGQGSLFAFGNLIDVDPEGSRSLTDLFAAGVPAPVERGADATRSSRSLVLAATAQGSDFTVRALRASLDPGAAVTEAGRQATVQLGRTVAGVRAIASPRTQSLIGGDPGNRRYWRTTQVALADVKTIKNALGGTVNDVVMTLVAGGYGTMMTNRGQDPSGQYLKVNIPVSVRAPGDLATNNQVTALFVQLPVSGPAPERLEWIRTHINDVKQAGTADALRVLIDMLHVAPALIQTAAVSLNGVFPAWMLDTLVTNVPGPPFATYLMGRRVARNMPIVALGTPLWCAVAVVSYDGQLNFGISTGEGGQTAGADICNGIHNTLDELLTAASQQQEGVPVSERHPMAIDDSLWLEIERPEQSTMVDGALLFGEQVDVDAIRQVVQERVIDRFPVMHRRPVPMDGQWFWEDDASFEIDHHVIDVRLRTRDVESARRYISRQRSTLLSRQHPMWAFHVIRGVEGLGPAEGEGTIVLTRFHHSIADGIRLVQLLLGLCDTVAPATVPNVGRNLGQSSGSSRAAGAAREISAGARDIIGTTTDAAGDVTRRLASSASQLRDEALRTIADPLGSARRAPRGAARLWSGSNSMVTTVFGQGAETLTHPARLVEAAVAMTSPDNRVANTMGAAVKLALPNPTARTVWSGRPGPIKDAYWCPPISMADIQAIRSRHPASVNDILLAILAATLTAYLREHGETSVTSTGWFIPASIKPLDQKLPESLGNHFVGLIAELPIGIDDPAELLAAVTDRMARIKNSDEAFLAFGLQRAALRLPSAIAGTLFDTTFAKVNGSLVSVPGPRGPMALAGHPVEAVLAFSPTVGDGPLAVTLFSYNGQVTTSMSVDRTLIPDSHRLPELFTEQAQRFIATLAR